MHANGDLTMEPANEMKERLESRAHGPFALTGPLARIAGTPPVRGDLAHVGLAGRYFVPHYALPQPRMVMPGGATLHKAPDCGSEQLRALDEGESFEVLDVTGEWAWGCLSLEGPSGYIHIDRLEAVGG